MPGVPRRSAFWCFPGCWEGSGCADHRGTRCCDYPEKTVEKKRHMSQRSVWSVNHLNCTSLSQLCFSFYGNNIKFQDGRQEVCSSSHLSKLEKPAGHCDMSDSLVILQRRLWHPTDRSMSVQTPSCSAPLWVPVCRRERKGPFTQITCEKERMRQPWHTYETVWEIPHHPQLGAVGEWEEMA